MRLGGGSSTTGGAGGGVLVTATTSVGGALVTAGGSDVGGATAVVSTTVAGVGGGSGGVIGVVPGASCRRYCAATKPLASAGASISVQAPLLPISVTVSPRLSIPRTLYSSPGPARSFNFFGSTV